MKQFTRQKLRGLLGMVLAVICMALAGFTIFLLGLEGLDVGEVTIRMKRSPPFIASANGPDAFRFQLYVWGFLLFGAFLVCCSVAITLYLIFSPRARRNAVFVRAGTAHVSSTSPDVPGWFAAAVLIGLISAFVFIAFKFS